MSRTGAWRTLLHMCNCCSGGTVVRSPRPLSRILAPCSARAYHSLIRDQSFVNGQWVPGSTAATFPVLNPANLSEVGSVADLAGEDVEQAIHAAREAFHPWADLTAKERGKYLRRWYELMEERKNELSQIMTLENGKPILEAEAEISYASSFLEWFAEEGKRIYGDVIPSPTRGSIALVTRHAIGPVGIITPWNFPAAMITRKVGAALASGCPVVVKPAEDTPLTALALAALAEEAGFPPGVVNVVTCGRENSIAAGKLFCSSPSIAGISFTGSTDVGKQLYAQCAPHVKRLSLELGGDAPFVVFESADVPAAVDGAMISKFRNAGQTCVCANRFFVHSAVYDEFVTGLRDRMKSLKVGNGLSPGVTIGPIINEAQIKRLEGLLADACSRGAELTVGGHRMPEVGPLFFAPTMIEHMSNEFACMTEEQFGPVVAVSRFETEEEVFHLANSSDRGLAGYAFTRDVGQALRIARYLEMPAIHNPPSEDDQTLPSLADTDFVVVTRGDVLLANGSMTSSATVGGSISSSGQPSSVMTQSTPSSVLLHVSTSPPDEFLSCPSQSPSIAPTAGDIPPTSTAVISLPSLADSDHPIEVFEGTEQIAGLVKENLKLKETLQMTNVALSNQCGALAQWQKDAMALHEELKRNFELAKERVAELEAEVEQLKEAAEKPRESPERGAVGGAMGEAPRSDFQKLKRDLRESGVYVQETKLLLNKYYDRCQCVEAQLDSCLEQLESTHREDQAGISGMRRQLTEDAEGREENRRLLVSHLGDIERVLCGAQHVLSWAEEADHRLREGTAGGSVSPWSNVEWAAENKALRERTDALTAKVLNLEDSLQLKTEECATLTQKLSGLSVAMDEIPILRAQVKLYEEDFRTERDLRLKLVAEKKMLEGRIRQLKKRLPETTNESEEQGSEEEEAGSNSNTPNQATPPPVYRGARPKEPRPSTSSTQTPSAPASTPGAPWAARRTLDDAVGAREGNEEEGEQVYSCLNCQTSFKHVHELRRHVERCVGDTIWPN